MDIFTKVILGLLSLDTIRALIAMLGWVKPDAKLAWIIYGRYERNLIVTALKEMGFAQDKREKVFRSFKKISSDLPRMTGVTATEAGIHLIVLLAKYIVKFPDEIRFGEGCGVSSNFYIDTMEIAHNQFKRSY
ncbi:MAG: hypothetical protein IKM73_14100 [Acidaminococcaceae bacterium]|nr:hypothetical protein [Acidaminococcaceae bacterium]